MCWLPIFFRSFPSTFLLRIVISLVVPAFLCLMCILPVSFSSKAGADATASVGITPRCDLLNEYTWTWGKDLSGTGNHGW